jgi:hypothetical protein
MSAPVDTSIRIYDDFSRLLFLHPHRETSTLVNDLPEESHQFHFLHTSCFGNLKGSVGLILVNVLFPPFFFLKVRVKIRKKVFRK